MSKTQNPIPLEAMSTEELLQKQTELLTNANLLNIKHSDREKMKTEVKRPSINSFIQPAIQSIPWIGISIGNSKHWLFVHFKTQLNHDNAE